MMRIVVVIFFSLYSVFIQAQQFPLFTNYTINTFGFNPAAIGVQNYGELRGITRNQWVGIEGRPSTNIFSFSNRLNKIPLALGITVYNDSYGKLSKYGGFATLAYSQRLGRRSEIAVGFSSGMYRAQLRNDAFVKEEPDGVVTGAQEGLNVPDLSCGVYFKQEGGLFAGVSVPQLYKKKILFDPSVQRLNLSQVVRQFHGIVGYQIPMNDFMTIEPSVLVKISPNVSPQYDISLRSIINKTFWIGGSLRTEDAVSAMAGIDLSKWMLAYSYDFTISQLRKQSSGSHEVVLALKFGGKCKDEDNDGICDKDDKCPKTAGPRENNGCPEIKEPKPAKCPDKDRDGVCDDEDECPELAGPLRNKGCPNYDRDGDGIRDDIDKCPDIPGNLKNEGCPLSDRDRDGILDDVDPCPDVPGTLANMGCPPETDRDKDGVPDKDDRCPEVAGPKSNHGCPKDGDRDGDGIVDSRDDCPNTAGIKSNKGCPEVSQEEKDLITVTIQNLYFDTDKSNIRPASYRNLNSLARLLKNKKDWKIRIEGHADQRGNQERNLQLSQQRAEAVKNYLVSKGVSPNLIYTEYFGASRPIITNTKDQSGLQMNRRVEIEFVFD